MNITINLGFGWTSILTFGLGALLVALLWYRYRRRVNVHRNRIESAVRMVVCDNRDNSIFEMLRHKAKKGTEDSRTDVKLLKKLITAAVSFTPEGTPAWRAWFSSRSIRSEDPLLYSQRLHSRNMELRFLLEKD